MQKQLKNVLTGGMDSDSDARAVAENDWRTSLNIRGGVAYAGKQGIITNVKGNEEIPYTLPAGSNKCIGAYQDIQANTILYFIWNSNGDCQILRYFADYNRIDLQVEYDFGWTADTNVTGIELINGKLLYWLDPQPRKINIEKARLIEPTAIATDKIKKWNVIVPKTVANMTSPYILTFKSRAGATLFISVGDVVGIPDREQVVSYLASLLNVSPSCPVIAEACGQTLELTEKVANTVWTIECNQATLVVADNWYGAVMTDRMFDRGKWMPPYEPRPTYEKDEDINWNRVRNQVFQFRTSYVYDDYEKSALSPISYIAINNIECNQYTNSDYNYILLNLVDPFLIDQTQLPILRKVNLYVREQNTGLWRFIEDIDISQYYDFVSGSQVCIYKFYNNESTTAIDDTYSSKPYDDIPLSASENLLIKNRSILANVVKGYDAPDCININITQEFEEDPNEERFTIRGILRIFNPQLDNNSTLTPRNAGAPNILESQSPILFDSAVNSDYPYFGGVTVKNSVAQIDKEAYTYCNQLSPEAGFPIYLAGTEYFCITKQKGLNAPGVTSNSNGSINVTTTQEKDNLKNYYQGSDRLNTDHDLYSTFEIPNVPNGEYVLRVASHLCSYGDKLGKGFMYDLYNTMAFQSTSTAVWGINQYNGVGSYTWIPTTEIRVIVNGGDVFVGDVIISDLCLYSLKGSSNTKTFDFLKPITGYAIDANGFSDQQALSTKGVPIQNAIVMAHYSFTFGGFNPQHTLLIDMLSMVTDHNGYFYLTEAVDVGNNVGFVVAVGVYQIKSPAGGALLLNPGGTGYYTNTATSALNDLYNQSLTFQSGGLQSPAVGFFERIYFSSLSIARQNCSSYVEGDVLDVDLNGISGALIVLANSGWTYTNNLGHYSILVWGNCGLGFNYITNKFINGTIQPPSQLNKYDGYVVLNYLNQCSVSYQTPVEYQVLMSNFYSNYTPTNTYSVSDFIVLIYENLGKARKRGGGYVLGIKYYDDLGRYCSVVEINKLYIPFINEDLGKYLPNYPIGTYKYGKPIISFQINSDAPSWAKYYRFLWTKNINTIKILQWFINDVKYITQYDELDNTFVETTFQNKNATSVLLNIGNIVNYRNQNPLSNVGYSFDSGDRIRLISKRDNSKYEYTDLRVVSYKPTGYLQVEINSSIQEILSGAEIEIYNPGLVTEDKIFYEDGDVYTCSNGVHSVVSGKFNSGDTYWVRRIVQVNDEIGRYQAVYPNFIENSSISDFFISQDSDIGRIGFIDPNFKQIHYPTMMQNSDIYVEGSAVNGLSSFESYNYKELNRAFGGINRLFYVGNTLLSIHENKVVANYIELRSLSDANNTDSLLAVSNAYFGNDRPMQSEYGCQHPNSAVQYNGFVYFLDASKGVVCRTDNNGLNSISDIKMRSYFRKLCAEGVTDAIGVFDPYYREYVVTIKTQKVVQQNPVIFNEETIAWGEDKNRWSTFYSFIPERYASVLRSIVSFVDGKFYLHDVSNTYNNFYGAQHRTELTVIPHTDDTKQTFHTVLLQGVQATPLRNDWGIENITNDYAQQSRLKKQHFRLKENFWCASFLRDLTDTTVVDPIINGRNIRGQELTCEFVNDATELVSLQQIITTITPSERSPK